MQFAPLICTIRGKDSTRSYEADEVNVVSGNIVWYRKQISKFRKRMRLADDIRPHLAVDNIYLHTFTKPRLMAGGRSVAIYIGSLTT